MSKKFVMNKEVKDKYNGSHRVIFEFTTDLDVLGVHSQHDVKIYEIDDDTYALVKHVKGASMMSYTNEFVEELLRKYPPLVKADETFQVDEHGDYKYLPFFYYKI